MKPLIVKKERNQNGRYPLSALNGNHLLIAINAYETNIKSNGTPETAKQSMVDSLMDEGKIMVKSVAEPIAVWLISEFVERKQVEIEESNKSIDAEDISAFIKFVISTNGAMTDRTDKVVGIFEPKNIVESSSVVVFGFGSNFKFIGREEVVNMFMESYRPYTALIENEKKALRDNIELPFIAAAPGIGKSRILQEIGLDMYNNKQYFPLFISFGNGTKMDVMNEPNPMNGLCVRIVYSILCAFTGSKGETSVFTGLLRKWNEFFGKRKVLDIETILIACNAVISPNEHTNFFIGMDEVQIINSHINRPSPLDVIISSIGQYMQHPVCGIIYPLFVGTYYTGIKKSFLGSAYSPKYIPTKPMLPTTELYQIMDDLVQTYNKLQGWRKNVSFKHYLRTFGGYARGIEFYLVQLLFRDLLPQAAWWEAKTKILEKYDVSFISSKVKNKILQLVVTRRVVAKNDKVEDDLTWSDLENQGLVMLEKAKGQEEFLITYPPVILPSLMTLEPREIYNNLFNSDSSVSSWEDVILEYYYLILTLLKDQKSLTLKELFPFAKMNPATANLKIEKIHSCYKCTHDKRLESDMSTRKYFNLKSGSTSFTYNPSNNTKGVYIIKNVPDASAGDVLVLGMKNELNGSDCVFHLQCKWADSKTAKLDFSTIEEVEIIKNNSFDLPTQNKIIPVTNITVIVTGKSITDMPESEKLPDNLIIIYKDNFSKHFGTLSEHMKYLYSTNYLHINECEAKGYENFGIGKQAANDIITKRTSDKEGFKDLEDLEKKVGKELFGKLKDLDIVF